MQRDDSRRQFRRLMEESGQLVNKNDFFIFFEATNARLVVNFCAYGCTVNFIEFHRKVGVIGSLVPWHLSERGDLMMAMTNYNLEQDWNIILFLFIVPSCIFFWVVFLLFASTIRMLTASMCKVLWCDM